MAPQVDRYLKAGDPMVTLYHQESDGTFEEVVLFKIIGKKVIAPPSAPVSPSSRPAPAKSPKSAAATASSLKTISASTSA